MSEKIHKYINLDSPENREVARSMKDDWRGGMIIYQGDEIKKIVEPDIWAVPSRRIFIG